ncbi:hypothetical protein BTM25_10860 [Actinomadura rubteroloni]|uniref:HNH endonuclease n=1 Tax=Actinomadura rubteroloni TaxID=1926885 RepID=A0A2P4UNS5_9ACTN|nr:hypothetical protein [Actinomadura rubteroloni]POM26682.1 hypothetical protein BTM25_10860 [Actinomadura rubteroloni]
MKRAALWLIAEVGEGNVFTKAQLREAFPDTAQIDRRMRDLRDHGWVIDTNREDALLGTHEQRFVTRGEPVWEPGRAAKPRASITATQRREILQADGHLCRSCGISAGQQYIDSYETAQLDVARRKVHRPGGSVAVEFVTECNRCRVGGRSQTTDVAELLTRVTALPSFERRILAEWVGRDSREFSSLEQLWALYRTLPADSRDEVRKVLGVAAGT